MIPDIRKEYNQKFKEENYKQFVNDLNNVYPGHLEFRIAETPVFVPAYFIQKVISACEYIIDVISTPEYKKASERAIPKHLVVQMKMTIHIALLSILVFVLMIKGNLNLSS